MLELATRAVLIFIGLTIMIITGFIIGLTKSDRIRSISIIVFVLGLSLSLIGLFL